MALVGGGGWWWWGVICLLGGGGGWWSPPLGFLLAHHLFENSQLSFNPEVDNGEAIESSLDWCPCPPLQSVGSPTLHGPDPA